MVFRVCFDARSYQKTDFDIKCRRGDPNPRPPDVSGLRRYS
jgi:hypothetical protein